MPNSDSASTTASAKASEREGSAVSNTRRDAARRRAAGTSSFFAAAAKIWSRTRRAAWMAALPVMSVTRDEYDPRSTGVRSVSAVTTRMSSGRIPSSSATT